MPNVETIWLYRMTHIKNIPHILKHGITHLSSAKKNKNYVAIGDGSLINRRNDIKLTNGARLGDYIPFYFGPRMPMLYVMKQGYNGVAPVNQAEVVYCVTSISAIQECKLDFMFTDGHAVDDFSEQYYPKDLKHIDSILDKKAINAKYWKDEEDLDLKRRKEAEFLVYGDIPIKAVQGFAVYNRAAATQIQEMADYNGQSVAVRPNYYF